MPSTTKRSEIKRLPRLHSGIQISNFSELMRVEPRLEISASEKGMALVFSFEFVLPTEIPAEDRKRFAVLFGIGRQHLVQALHEAYSRKDEAGRERSRHLVNYLHEVIREPFAFGSKNHTVLSRKIKNRRDWNNLRTSPGLSADLDRNQNSLSFAPNAAWLSGICVVSRAQRT